MTAHHVEIGAAVGCSGARGRLTAGASRAAPSTEAVRPFGFDTEDRYRKEGGSDADLKSWIESLVLLATVLQVVRIRDEKYAAHDPQLGRVLLGQQVLR